VPGNYALAFSATGYTGIVSPTIALARAPTAITIRSDDPDPSVTGAPVRVRYRVESAGGTPTGLVRITSDDGASCSGSVAQAECSLSFITPGARTLTATYAGDTQFEGSSTTALHQVDAPAPSVLILVTQPSATATSGQPFGRQPVVQLRDASGAPLSTAGVTVAAAIATGTGTLAGTAARTTGADGRAVFTDLAVAGTGTFTLRFSAEGFVAVVSEAIAVAPAGPAATTTTITADDPDPSDAGQAVTVRFTVSAASGTPTGAVTISASAAETCAAVIGVGTCSLTLTQPGTRTITAAYAGDGAFAGSSGTATHTVRAPPAVPSASTSSVEVKDATIGLTRRTDVTVTVRDAAGAALENVSVVLSATGTGNLISPASAPTDKKGHAKFAFSSTDAGTKTVTAVAGGVTITQRPTITVTPAASQTRITSDSPDPSGAGAPLTVAYTVTSDAGTPAGDVTVTASGGGGCSATVAAGGCTLVPGGGGAVTLTASYAGSANFAASSDQQAHTVNPPDAAPNGQADAFTATEDQALQVSPRGVLTNDSDPNGGPVQASLDASPAHGQLDLGPDGGFRYVPSPDFAGEDGFTYRASDGALASGPVAVRLTVAPVNDPPSFDAGPNQTVAGSAGPQTVSDWATSISPGPADESGQQVTFEEDVTLGQALFTVQPAVAPNGTLTFTPSGLPGTALVSVVAHDDGGRSGAGNDTSDATVFIVLVTPGL
jgi:large repetitive protein